MKDINIDLNTRQANLQNRLRHYLQTFKAYVYVEHAYVFSKMSFQTEEQPPIIANTLGTSSRKLMITINQKYTRKTFHEVIL